VVLVNSKHAHKPVHAQAKAQTNLDAGGNTDEDRRARTPLPPSAQTHEGDDITQAERRVQELEAEQRRVMSQLKAAKAVHSDPGRNAPQTPQPTPTLSGLDLASRALATASLEAQIDRQFDEYNKRPRKKFIGTRTEEYVPAQYLEDWRQKVERIGNLNYPEAAKGRFYGSLVIYIEINAEGELERAEVQRSSGYRVLDAAAIRILKLASPYGKFPADLKRQTDILAFARTWTFTQADQLQSQ
jgi:protein TonB